MTVDNSALLNDEDKQILEKWKEKFKDATCELCGGKNWQFNDRIFSTLSFDKGKMLNNPIAYPHIFLVCENCSNTKVLGSINIGLHNPFKNSDDKE